MRMIEAAKVRLASLPSYSVDGEKDINGVSRRWRTRFAPSPTGYLHLGHLVNVVHVWGVARAHDGDVLLRMEDHDRIRFRPEYESAILDDLEWLGFEPDIFPTRSFRPIDSPDIESAMHPTLDKTLHKTSHPARQSDQNARYRAAAYRLMERGLLYACGCSRREIAQAAGDERDHGAGIEYPYPGTCRSCGIARPESDALRVRLDERTYSFDDLRLGLQRQEPWRQSGDVLIRDRHRQWTYQFAVVADDIAHEIDVIIRGEDLLTSTGRQLQIAELLGRPKNAEPVFLHHALIRHHDGTKLSKAKNDTAIGELRRAGLKPAELLGQAAFHAELLEKPISIEPNDIASLFS